MKTLYSKLIIALALIASLGFYSCNDFLTEEKTNSYSTQYFETEEGIISLATALYANIRWHSGYEWAYGITLYGTDEFTSANDLTAEPWNKYDSRFNPMNATVATGAANANCPPIDALWNQMYYGIATANLVIANADKITNDDIRKKCVGEAYFLRGYNYYRLFAQYGGVVLQLKPAEGIIRNFSRADAETTLNQVISDFQTAYDNLPTSKWRNIGTWTKYTAAHFLAKSLLYRCSERNSDWNADYITADLDKCIKLCDEVITACPLAADYWDLYARWTGIDCENENLPEILMTIQHNGDANTQGRFGNRTYNYFQPQFSNFTASWVKRGIWIGGMDFQRCRPTEYNYATYDNVNDARLWKSFKTVFGINNLGTVQTAVAGNAPVLGDKAVAFILNTKNDHRFDSEPYGDYGRPTTSTFIDPETNKWIPNVFPLFLNGTYVQANYGVSGDPVTSNVFCGLNKTEDGSRTAEKGDAHRDVILARTGETYLVKAEALVRQSKFQEAIGVINQLRTRGQWKAGEERDLYVDGSIAFEKNSLKGTGTNEAMFKNSFPGYPITGADGKTYLTRSTYYLSTGIAPTTAASSLQIASFSSLPPEDEAILTALQCSGDKDRMLNFIFNERTRELNGEWNRWEELSRTKLLVRRTKTFNSEASPNIEERHNLRPIPQTFIDGLTQENGEPLTDSQKQELQNPGYN
ncbi:MAG: RagB/SusD family nutrient uptake outer membrane protein [Prevotellaceae bacterium]|jgi:hypothetical protein|nr:RagB/SusD family nutrient uptake outer membrane protein [Prevotellaceae bacterium]